ncbi:hypothetical protein CHS0354_037703 [Potamilus streckersoni]|uniref:RING-type domain-containing protein n=1 Tax=Potamilus streckersoni TaxID=2493646 RepID=A0AAE0T071_9BIVA|nr:hypothetical protein CHS0354_037703 [Potamilus streckersoni]
MIGLKIPREYIVTGVSIILRVPSLFLLEVWYRWDNSSAVEKAHEDQLISTGLYYSTLLLAVTLAALPVERLVSFYMYIVSICFFGIAYYLSEIYVEAEKKAHWLLKGDNEALFAFIEDMDSIIRLGFILGLQCMIAALVAYLLNITDWTKYTFLVFTAPVIARIAGLSVKDLSIVHNFATIYVILMVMFYILNNLGYAMDILKDGINQVVEAARIFGWIPVLMIFWQTVMLPVQLLTFWISLFSVQLYVYFSSDNNPIVQEGTMVVFLAAIGDCCGTPISLFALCITISYTSYYILTLTKFYLQGFDGLMEDNEVLRGWTEGLTMLLIATQTGLLDLKPLQRAFLMSILLFIVASSLIQSMYEVTDPILLALSASHNKKIFKHVRALILCTFLWMCPLYMTYCICQYFSLDFWLMIIISSCVLTSVQVIGSLVIYTLFMYDSFRMTPWESLDDIVYYTRASVRILEFVVALFVVCYGIKESFWGEWSWVNSSILMVHCYFNVWQRLQSGWKSFLLRRDAVKKLESLPLATEEELANIKDVCAICFQEMHSARITNCKHFYHNSCLKKWLYIKDACPMCHQPINKITSQAEEENEERHAAGEEGDEDSEDGYSSEDFNDDFYNRDT